VFAGWWFRLLGILQVPGQDSLARILPAQIPSSARPTRCRTAWPAAGLAAGASHGPHKTTCCRSKIMWERLRETRRAGFPFCILSHACTVSSCSGGPSTSRCQIALTPSVIVFLQVPGQRSLADAPLAQDFPSARPAFAGERFPGSGSFKCQARFGTL